MRDLLENWGCYAICVPSGEYALKRLQMSNARADLILCDYRLANAENGIQVITDLRNQQNNCIPAILITGDMDPSLAARVQPLMIELLEKPICPAQLKPLMECKLKVMESAAFTG
jgi:CheY-like chemotaxis protein